MAAFAAKRPPTSLHVQTWHCLSAKESIPRRVGTRSSVQGWFAANAAGGRGRGRERTDASAHETAYRAGLPQMRPEDAAGDGKGRTRRHTKQRAGLVCRKCGRARKKTCIRGEKSTQRNSVRPQFFPFPSNIDNLLTYNHFQQLHKQLSKRKKTRIKNKMHAIFFFPIIMKKSNGRKTT